MSETIITQTPNTYTECEYKSRDGVSITVFSTSDNTKWQIAIQTKSYTNRSTSYLKISSLPEIINYLKNGQQLLKEKLSRWNQQYNFAHPLVLEPGTAPLLPPVRAGGAGFSPLP